MDVWECELFDVKWIRKCNDGIKKLLSFIDIFSKLLHVLPLKSKTGTSVTAAFHRSLKAADTRNPYQATGLSANGEGKGVFEQTDSVFAEARRHAISRVPELRRELRGLGTGLSDSKK
jgi:hypothetical protein